MREILNSLIDLEKRNNDKMEGLSHEIIKENNIDDPQVI